MEGPVVADRFYCVLKYHEDGTVEFLYQCISYDAALKHQWEQNSKLLMGRCAIRAQAEMMRMSTGKFLLPQIHKKDG